MDALIVMLVVEASVMVPCLAVALIAILRRRNSSSSRGGRHRHGAAEVHRMGGSVAAIREREGADELRYYPWRIGHALYHTKPERYVVTHIWQCSTRQPASPDAERTQAAASAGIALPNAAGGQVAADG